ncbi:DNA-binding protein [Tepidiphilus thermophilus]|uniref:Plasmid replication region DNA-binding N-term n=1 Tax=Tepidiphilus thermophilus TaxID=876478 RepID=A0A0K6IY48_9PROT|nr:DNA-binding protein [Tepidiphilus thermophilus]CUB08040.1 Plasmid replication region DNA-binding N-term [Tepidiphilus thermophilus]
MALTRDDIWAVADRLDAEGKAPTLAAVRKALGSGSFTTISEAMREWHQRRKEKADKAQEAGPVPPDLDETVRRFAQEVWAKATEIAKAEVLRLTSEYTEAKKEWDRERQELEAVAEDLLAALDELQAKSKEDQEAFADMARRLVETEAHVITLKEQARENEARIEELRRENDRLHALLRRALQQDGGTDENQNQQP